MPGTRWWIDLMVVILWTAQSQAQSVHGRVVDPAGKPIALAQVYLLPSGPTATTDFHGAFTLKGIREGTDTLAIRRLGFRPDTVVVQLPSQRTALTIHLNPAPTELEAVTSSALRQDLPRLFERMKTDLGGVAFGADLRKKYPHTDIDDILKFDWDLRRNAINQMCGGAAVWIDGIRLLGAPISAYVRLDEIAAVEAFHDKDFVHEPFIEGTLPPEFCRPIILIWTKGFRQHPWGG